MLHKTIKVFVYFMLSFLFSTCGHYEENFVTEGYSPLYETPVELEIHFKDPQPLREPGKIYIYGKYLLINELNKGIHVFDNSDPSVPKALGFLTITGNLDLVVRNNILYVDHLGDLVALDIIDLYNIKEVSRVHVWDYQAELPPPNSYFECIDAKKGVIVGWERKTLLNPKCRR